MNKYIVQSEDHHWVVLIPAEHVAQPRGAPAA